MKEFVFLIRINPEQLSPDLVADLGKSWQPLISGWMQQDLLVSSLIFRESGILLSSGGKAEQTYLREQDDVLTGCFVLKADDFAEATALGKAFPTLGIGGTVEIRELQKINNDKIFKNV